MTENVDLFSGVVAGVNTENDERARAAVKAFRALQPTLTSYARVLTKRTDVRVEMAARDNGSTDGKKIYFRPPIALGDKTPHDRRQCDKRDETKRLLCRACDVREQVLVTIYHEIAHICFDSFQRPDAEAVAEAIKAAVREAGGKYADAIAHRIDSAPSFKTRDYINLASLISPFLPIIFNALEDARVNRELFKARKGTRVMFDASLHQVFNEGVEQIDPDTGKVVTIMWNAYPLNLQAMLGVFCKAATYDYSTWFRPDVVEALNDDELTRIIRKLDNVRSAAGAYHLSFEVLKRLRELGFCKSDTDPEEEENDDDGQPAAEQHESEPPDEDDEPDEEPEEGSSEEDSDDEDESASDEPDDGSGDVPGDGDDEAEPSDPGAELSEAEGSGEPRDSDGSGDPSDADSEGGDEASGGDRDSDDEPVREDQSDGDSDGRDDEGGSDASSGSDDSDSSHRDDGQGEPDDGGSGDQEVSGDADDASDGEEAGEGDSDGNDLNAQSSAADGRGEQDGSSSDGDDLRGSGGADAGDEATGESGDSGTEAGRQVDARSTDETEGDRSAEAHDEPSDDGSGRDDLQADGSADGSDQSAQGDVDQEDHSRDLEREADVRGDSGDLHDDLHGQRPVEPADGDGREVEPTGVEEDDLGGLPSAPEGAEDDDAQEAIDSGADKGLGGTTLEEREEYDRLPMGTPSEVEEALKVFGDHDEQPKTVEEQAADNTVDRAIIQGLYFETPSRNIFGVREHHYDEPLVVDGYNMSSAWAPASRRAIGYDRKALGIDGDFVTPESILGPALMKMRVAFSDNQRGKEDRNRKSGKIDARVLGKRAHHNDPRLFKKKTLPGKKSYFVIISLDVSGSTVGKNIQIIKQAAMAQASLCDRMGIPFAIYAHSGNMHSPLSGRYDGLDLDVYVIKSKEEIWNDKVKIRLTDLGPDSLNLDGHALEYLRKRADESDATDTIILYYSDGKMPAENHDEELEILQREIKVCKQKGYTLLGVGIRTDSPARHGLDTVQVDSVEEVGKVVSHLSKRLTATN